MNMARRLRLREERGAPEDEQNERRLPGDVAGQLVLRRTCLARGGAEPGRSMKRFPAPRTAMARTSASFARSEATIRRPRTGRRSRAWRGRSAGRRRRAREPVRPGLQERSAPSATTRRSPTSGSVSRCTLPLAIGVRIARLRRLHESAVRRLVRHERFVVPPVGLLAGLRRGRSGIA